MATTVRRTVSLAHDDPNLCYVRGRDIPPILPSGALLKETDGLWCVLRSNSIAVKSRDFTAWQIDVWLEKLGV